MKPEQVVITNKEFNDLLEANLDYLKNYFKNQKRTGFIPSLMLYERGNYHEKFGFTMIVLADDEDFDHRKYQIVSLAGIKYGQEEPANQYTSVAFICSEGWMRHAQPVRDKMIADYDDKVEVIICMGMTVDGRVNHGTFKVRRDKKDRIFDLRVAKKFEYTDGVSSKESARSDLLQAFWRGYAAGKLKSQFGSSEPKAGV